MNSGVWDGNLAQFAEGATVTGFSEGDQIQFSVTLGPAQFRLLSIVGPNINTALQIIAPGSGNYTVPAGIDTYKTRNNAGSTVNVTATCVPAPTPTPDNASYDRAVTKGFLLSRINGMLLNSPGAMSLVNRNNTTVGGARMASAGNGASSSAGGVGAFASAMGLGAGLDDSEEASLGSRNIQFSQSLSGLRRQATDERMKRERMSLGAGDGATLPLAYEINSPWDIWVEGRYSGFSDDSGNIDRDGHVGLLYVGGDYRVAHNMIVGVVAQFDWAKDDSGVLGSSVDGNGWMIGPYMSMQVHENVYFDVRASWGRSDNDLSIGATTGSFDTSRWLVKGTLAGNWMYDAWRITPSAELAYVTENQDSFTNSSGVFVAGQDVSLGRLQFGPEVGYRFAHTADTFIEPFAAIKGVWDWDNPNVQIIDGFVVGPGDFWGRLEGGLNVATSNGWLVRGMASWDGLGTNDYNGYTLQGIVNVPLN